MLLWPHAKHTDATDCQHDAQYLNALIAHAENPMTQVIGFILNVLMLIPLMIFSVRRLHDFNL